MKKLHSGVLMYISLALFVALYTGCAQDTKKSGIPLISEESSSQAASDQGMDQTTTDTTPNEPVADKKDAVQVVSDTPAEEKKFDYSTTITADFSLSVQDIESGAPVPLTSISIYDGSDTLLSSGITDAKGEAFFKVTAESASTLLTIIIKNDDYGEYRIVVENIQKLSSIERLVKLRKKPPEVKPADADNDGVADAEDEFPNDPRYAKSVKGEYTLAFEDMYPKKGDADFNDAVVRLSLEERIDSKNRLAYVKITAQALASGAGYSNQFAINVLDREYVLIENFKKDLKGKWNSKEGKDDSTCTLGPEHVKEIVLETPVDRLEIAAMPYDPFLIPNGASSGKKLGEVHLSFVSSEYKKKGNRVLDDDGFPWALSFAGEWCWPYESGDIRKAYPDFQKWYESEGREARAWYQNPDASRVYCSCMGQSASSLSAYLLGTGSGNAVLVVVSLGIIGLIIGGIYVWKRKHPKA